MFYSQKISYGLSVLYQTVWIDTKQSCWLQVCWHTTRGTHTTTFSCTGKIWTSVNLWTSVRLFKLFWRQPTKTLDRDKTQCNSSSVCGLIFSAFGQLLNTKLHRGNYQFHVEHLILIGQSKHSAIISKWQTLFYRNLV